MIVIELIVLMVAIGLVIAFPVAAAIIVVLIAAFFWACAYRVNRDHKQAVARRVNNNTADAVDLYFYEEWKREGQL